MKTLRIGILCGILGALVGCGDGSDVTQVDAGPAADACVQGQGNCGCILFQDIKYVDNVQVSTSHLVCPGDDH